MGGFSDLVDDMDELVMSSLNDGTACYRPPQMGAPGRDALEVIIERNLQLVGANGAFQSSLVGVTWRKRCLAEVAPGGMFIYGRERFIVEKTVDDDGEWVTAACQVQP